MRYIFLCLLFSLSLIAKAQDFLELQSRKTNYSVGENATIIGNFLTIPSSTGYEFFIKATLNGAPLAFKPITTTEQYAVTSALGLAGSYTVLAEIYQQDKDQAKALNDAISFYSSEMDRINALLATTTDPAQIAALQAEKTRDSTRKSESEALLDRIRVKLPSTTSLNFLVQ